MPRLLIALALMSGIISLAVLAQGASGPPRSMNVVVLNPVVTIDGGAVTVYSAPGFTTALLGGTEVGLVLGTEVGLVAGTTVALSATSLDALTGGTCEVFDRAWQTVGTGAVIVPADGGTPGRTAIHLYNRDGTREMSCGTNSTPTFGPPGLGHWLPPNGGFVSLPVRDSSTVRCIANTAGGTNNLVVAEEVCTSSSLLGARISPKGAVQ